MKKRLLKYGSLLSFCVIFLLTKSYSQTDTLAPLIHKIDYPIVSFSVGNLGELYLINSNNQLRKYDENGDPVGVYNQVTRFGKLAFVEAQNPWRTILFYKNFQTIVLLDKYLSPISTINLKEHNIFKAEAVTTSYDNNIWVFDEQENKLKKMDDTGKLLFESNDFRQLFDSVPSPQRIIDQDGFLYLYDMHRGLYIFDYYGTFKNRLPFTGWKSLAIIDKNIYGFDTDHYYKNTPPSPINVEMPLPVVLRNSDELRISNRKIYVLKKGKLYFYDLK